MASLLIVDDERQLTDAFADFFERQGGHTVTRAYTGEDAIAAFHAARPDLVMLDMRSTRHDRVGCVYANP